MSLANWQNQCLEYVGHHQTSVDDLAPRACNALLATLNDTISVTAGEPVPPLFHWLYFNSPVHTDQLKTDGHEKLGGFLPPVPYPRRMWAGSTIEFHSALLSGEMTERTSTIKSVEFKTGSTGALCFVNVEHSYYQCNTLCLVDVHTIVYRDNPASGAQSVPSTKLATTVSSDCQSLSSIELFRYSALTFNSHRIHYDHDYCRDIEGYPGLVAHGPLLATLLIRYISSVAPTRPMRSFSFRALAPVFAEDTFTFENVNSRNQSNAFITKTNGIKAMSATAQWAL